MMFFFVDWQKQIFGLSDKVNEWFWSYLKQHSQRVSAEGVLSNVLSLFGGVPHGPVLRPLIITMYTRPLGITARRFVARYHFYADDTQLYVSLDVGNESKVTSSLEYCIADMIKQILSICLHHMMPNR